MKATRKCKDCAVILDPKRSLKVQRCRQCYYKFICSGKPWLNKNWLKEHYYDKKMSFVSIAKLCGVKSSTIDHAFTDKFKLKARPRNMKGSNNLSWKGGRITRNGYIFLYYPKPHLRKSGDGTYVPEHVLIAEKSLKRNLKDNEHVHHKNGIKTDNRPENLQILSAKEHAILEHQLGFFAKLIIFGDLVPHLQEELQSLFTSFLSKNE